MNKLRLDVDTLEVSSFEAMKAEAAPQPVVQTGATGYCNTCWRCDWTA